MHVSFWCTLNKLRLGCVIYSNMENLFCEEEWSMTMSPDDSPETDESRNVNIVVDDVAFSFYPTTEDREETFRAFMNKETSFMPKPGYLNLLESDSMVRNARFEAVNWLIKSQRRMNLTAGTIFGAVNYLDRFISTTQCQGWKYEIFELLSIACLSVSSKFNDTNTPPLHHFQVEKLEHSIAPSLIQKMELTLMEALEWRMDCVTSYSYVQLLIPSIELNTTKSLHLEHLITSRATELLLSAVSDGKVLEFRPCVIATSAVRCILEDLSSSRDGACLQCLSTDIITNDHKDDLIKCQTIVDELFEQHHPNVLSCGDSWPGPSSPVTVLKAEHCSLYDVSGVGSRSTRKRKREQLGNW